MTRRDPTAHSPMNLPRGRRLIEEAGALASASLLTFGALALVAQMNAPRPHAPPHANPEPILVAAPPPAPPPAPSADARSAEPQALSPMLHPAALAPAAITPLFASALDLGPTLPALSASLPALALEPTSVEPDRPAEPKRVPSPRYPEVARRRGVEGQVLVRMRVDAEGRVVSVVVVESEPRDVFDEAARDAARRATFAPAVEGGRPVASTVEQRIHFRLR